MVCFLIALEFESLTIQNFSPPPIARRKRRRGRQRKREKGKK